MIHMPRAAVGRRLSTCQALRSGAVCPHAKRCGRAPFVHMPRAAFGRRLFSYTAVGPSYIHSADSQRRAVSNNETLYMYTERYAEYVGAQFIDTNTLASGTHDTDTDRLSIFHGPHIDCPTFNHGSPYQLSANRHHSVCLHALGVLEYWT